MPGDLAGRLHAEPKFLQPYMITLHVTRFYHAVAFYNAYLDVHISGIPRQLWPFRRIRSNF